MDRYDFSGWATRNNLRCSDGRVIMPDAFKHNDGETVPLVWNHQHDRPDNILGHALLENRDEGVYAYCTFNDTPTGRTAKMLVENGDVKALSIHANQLKHNGANVIHGAIREVSLVLAGANPGAFIESVIKHGEESDEEAIFYNDEDIMLVHGEEEASKEDEVSEEVEVAKEDETLEHAEENKEEAPAEKEEPAKDKTIAEVLETFNDEQKKAFYAMIGEAVGDDDDEENIEHSEGGNENMKANVFDQNDQKTDVLSHSDVETIMKDAKRLGSLRESVMAFAESKNMSEEEFMHSVTDSHGKEITYGIADIDYLFPDARNLNTPPSFIARDMEWVGKVMHGVHHTPFSRIKSMFANITKEDARAKGYTKGKKKIEEVFGLLKRTTTPTTIYKKQKLDRDDVLDITDFDVVAWLKREMRMMLDEEIARAILVGDGRDPSSDDKINELNIRPIWTDDELYTIKQVVDVKAGATADEKSKAFIRAAVKARKDYKGSGNPVLFTTEDVLTDCLLMEDQVGHRLYDSPEKLAHAMRVSSIVTVPVMENLTRTVEDKTHTLLGLIVNLNDYNVGADKGGAVAMFDDFDIDYNQQKYLIETRCSGALTVPYSAIALETVAATAEG